MGRHRAKKNPSRRVRVLPGSLRVVRTDLHFRPGTTPHHAPFKDTEMDNEINIFGLDKEGKPIARYRQVSISVPEEPRNDWEVAGLVFLGLAGLALGIGALVEYGRAR